MNFQNINPSKPCPKKEVMVTKLTFKQYLLHMVTVYLNDYATEQRRLKIKRQRSE